jgi:hypothetical protein
MFTDINKSKTDRSPDLPRFRRLYRSSTPIYHASEGLTEAPPIYTPVGTPLSLSKKEKGGENPDYKYNYKTTGSGIKRT